VVIYEGRLEKELPGGYKPPNVTPSPLSNSTICHI